MSVIVLWMARSLGHILLLLLALACLVTKIQGEDTQTVIEGLNATFICNRGSTGYAAVIWYFYATNTDNTVSVADISYDGTLSYSQAGAWANEISNIGNSHLVIDRLRLDRDEGYFRCSLGITTLSTIKVTVLVPVTAVSLVPTTSVSLSTEQTGTTTFTCTVTSKPRATVTWQRVKTDTGTVPLSNVTESITTHDKLTYITSTLSYTPQKEHNGDSIRCTATSPANTSPVYTSNETRLIIHYPPASVRAISGYSGRPVNENNTESIHLTCSVDGVANPNNTLVYSWSSYCGTGAESTSQISVSPNRTMNNKLCYCTVKHPETTWTRNSPSIKFTINYHPYSVNTISGYTGPMNESSSSVQLICNVNGGANPAPLTYLWSTDCGSGVRSGYQISVPRNRTMNNKQCYCTVSHPETGWDKDSPAITFNFLYPPDSVRAISGYSGPITESIAEYMRLICSVDGVPNPNNSLVYSWSSDCGAGVRSTSEISVSHNRTMNNKQCYCTVTHPETGWEQDSSRVTFNIYFGPDSVVITEKTTATTMTGISGNRTSLRCTGFDSNPVTSLNWYNTTGGSKTPVSPDVSGPPQNGTYGQTAHSTYNIVPSRYDDGHQITCEGQNPRVSDNKQSDYVILDISYPPLLEPEQTSIENKVVVENTQLILTCTAWAKPLADITWTPRPPTSRPSVDMDDGNFRRTSTFTLPAINRTEIGLYKCSASNIHGHDGDMQNQGFNVTVHYVPDVAVSASRTPVAEGDSTQLECYPSAVPNYTSIDWTQHVNGVKVRKLSAYSMSRELNLNNLTFEDTGEYRCSVTNIVGKGTGKESITIKYAPKLVDANNASSGMNGTARLSLTFIGDPQPNVTWYKDGSNSSLNDSSQRFSTDIKRIDVSLTFYDTPVTISGYEATLTIYSVQVQDYAGYHATLDNGLKSDSQIPRFSARLIPNDKPQHPSNFKAVCDVTTAVVSWVSQFNGGLPQTFYLSYSNNEDNVNVSKTEQDSDKGNAGTVDVETLKAGRNYTFVIFARNSLGDRGAVTTSCQTKQVVVTAAPQTEDDSNTVAIAVGVAVPLVIIIAILLAFVIIRLQRQKYHKATKRDSSELNAGDSNNMADIATSTDRLVDVGVAGGYSEVSFRGATVHSDNEKNNLAESSLYSEVAQKPGMPLYASVEENTPPATAQKTDKSTTSPVYAEVNKAGKTTEHEEADQNGDLSKPEKKGKKLFPLVKAKPGKKASKDSSPVTEEEIGPVYAEVNKATKPDPVLTSDPGPLYAEVDKSKKNKKQADPGPLYAEVDKTKKKKKPADPGPLYAEVDKSKKNKKNSDSDEKQKGDVGPKPPKRLFIKKNESDSLRKSAALEKSATGTEYEDVDVTLIEKKVIPVNEISENPYENSANETKRSNAAAEEVAYETVGEMEQSLKEQKSQETEGMLYADLAFVDVTENKPSVPASKPSVPIKPPRASLKRKEEQTEYASIDHINTTEQEEDLGMV